MYDGVKMAGSAYTTILGSISTDCSRNLSRMPFRAPECGLQSGVSRYITIDDLRHANVSTLGHHVECLRFHACRVHSSPLEILLRQLGIWGGLGLLGDRLQCRGPIDRLCSTCNIGDSSYDQFVVYSDSIRETDCCLSQFIPTAIL